MKIETKAKQKQTHVGSAPPASAIDSLRSREEEDGEVHCAMLSLLLLLLSLWKKKSVREKKKRTRSCRLSIVVVVVVVFDVVFLFQWAAIKNNPFCINSSISSTFPSILVPATEARRTPDPAEEATERERRSSSPGPTSTTTRRCCVDPSSSYFFSFLFLSPLFLRFFLSLFFYSGINEEKKRHGCRRSKQALCLREERKRKRENSKE